MNETPVNNSIVFGTRSEDAWVDALPHLARLLVEPGRTEISETVHVGGVGLMTFPLDEAARVTDPETDVTYSIMRRDYGNGPELVCGCGTPSCAHVAALETD